MDTVGWTPPSKPAYNTGAMAWMHIMMNDKAAFAQKYDNIDYIKHMYSVKLHVM